MTTENTTPRPTGTLEGFIGSSPITSIVHKQDHEGSIMIDPVTGNILTLLADRPDWASELTVAQVTQRHKYYSTALGEQYGPELQNPEIMAFEDIDWLAVRELDLSDEDEALARIQDPNFDGFEHYEMEADAEWRASVVATVLGIKGDLEQMEQDLLEGKDIAGVDLSAELLADNFRTQEEIEQLEESRAEKFSKAV